MSVECGHLKCAFIFSMSFFHFGYVFNFILLAIRFYCIFSKPSVLSRLEKTGNYRSLSLSFTHPKILILHHGWLFKKPCVRGESAWLTEGNSSWEAPRNIQGARINCEHLPTPTRPRKFHTNSRHSQLIRNFPGPLPLPTPHVPTPEVGLAGREGVGALSLERGKKPATPSSSTTLLGKGLGEGSTLNQA